MLPTTELMVGNIPVTLPSGGKATTPTIISNPRTLFNGLLRNVVERSQLQSASLENTLIPGATVTAGEPFEGFQARANPMLTEVRVVVRDGRVRSAQCALAIIGVEA